MRALSSIERALYTEWGGSLTYMLFYLGSLDVLHRRCDARCGSLRTSSGWARIQLFNDSNAAHGMRILEQSMT